MSIIKKDLISSSKYGLKSPYTMNPMGICIHNTANDAPAKNEISYMKNNNSSTSFHIAVDDKEAIQAIPFNRSAWHAGDGSNGKGNRNYIGIEICYSKSGGERFKNAEKLAAKVVVEILNQYKWGIDKVKKHQDFSGKYCPHKTLDMGWNRFLDIIRAEINKNNSGQSKPSTSKPKPSSELYRVRKTWSDVSSQKGAYSDKNNAIAECKKHPGYKVFNSAGKEVYSNSASNPSTPPKKPNNVKQNTRSIQFLCNKVLGSKLALDGIWGKNTEAQVKKLKLCGYPYVNRDCTRYVQEVLGINEDGIFGRNTEKKVKEFQKKHGLSCDGIVGFNTYKALAIK